MVWGFVGGNKAEDTVEAKMSKGETKDGKDENITRLDK